VAGRAGSGASRKRTTGKRRSGRKRPRILLIAALMALIAGFLVRRTMLPSAMHYIAHRAPDHEPPAADVGRDAATGERENAHPNSPSKVDTPSEHLTSRDRHDLDSLIDRKAK
jgi:hypothetical protein